MRAAHPVVAVAAAILGLTACGGGSPSPKVASLGPTTTAAAAATPTKGASDLTKMTQYASCMRSHGVPSFPDPTPGPNGGGGFQLRGGPGTGFDPNSATFQSAQNACKSLLPNGGVAPQMTPAQQQAILDWAACIRTHGVPDFPDPQFSGGGVRIGGGGPNVDPNSPTFQAAQKACQSKAPGIFKVGPGGR